LLSYEEAARTAPIADFARPVEAVVAQLLPRGKKWHPRRCSQPAPHRRWPAVMVC